MTWFEKWFLHRVFRKEVRQGFDHSRHISELYALIREAAEREFFEDNAPTLDASLLEYF